MLNGGYFEDDASPTIWKQSNYLELAGRQPHVAAVIRDMESRVQWKREDVERKPTWRQRVKKQGPWRGPSLSCSPRRHP
jgi:hypothetical protein